MPANVQAMFRREGEAFMPLDRARGPWNPAFLHGGASGALLGHAVESLRTDPAFLTTRMTFDLMQPVPVAPLRFTGQVVREGRRVRYVDVLLHAGEAVVARASAVMLRRGEPDAGATTLPTAAPLPAWHTLPPGAWMDRPDDRALFHAGLAVRLVRQPYVNAPMAVWVHVPYELMPGRPLTPVERAATVADLTNGIGLMSRGGPLQPTINGDITLYLHREPTSEWLALDCAGRGDHHGLATSSVNLLDETGLFGHAVVSAMRNPLPA